MAPTEGIRLPLRWQFAPEREPRDASIRWRWRAYAQAGLLALESGVA